VPSALLVIVITKKIGWNEEKGGERFMKKCLSLLFVMSMLVAAGSFMVATPVKAATSYYVSYSSGSDTNNGTSSSTPWKTLAIGQAVRLMAVDLTSKGTYNRKN
jgi:hypothetical protein